MPFELKNARYLAADYISRVVTPGASVVDATMGNGHDTLMLAKLVGPSGKVWAFDVQLSALENTRQRLKAEDVLAQVRLLQTGHENMAIHVEGPVHAVMMNLGWLPGGDKTVTTLLPTTLAAIRQGLHLLCPGGLMTICAYPGHEEGARERDEVEALLSELPVQCFSVLAHHFSNHPNYPPCLYLVQKAQ